MPQTYKVPQVRRIARSYNSKSKSKTKLKKTSKILKKTSKILKKTSQISKNKTSRKKSRVSRNTKSRKNTHRATKSLNKNKEIVKISKKETKVQQYKKTHRLLKLSDFTNLQAGQLVIITFIHDEEQLKTFTFKFNRIEPTKGNQRKWYTHYIYGSSGYTRGLPLGVKKSTGEIRYAESSDISPAYLDKPIKIQKLKPVKLRPSPSESATLFKVGTKKVGNDKNIWVIVETVTGTKRWKLDK